MGMSHINLKVVQLKIISDKNSEQKMLIILFIKVYILSIQRHITVMAYIQ
jgi:hypothetical protein